MKSLKNEKKDEPIIRIARHVIWLSVDLTDELTPALV